MRCEQKGSSTLTNTHSCPKTKIDSGGQEGAPFHTPLLQVFLNIFNGAVLKKEFIIFSQLQVGNDCLFADHFHRIVVSKESVMGALCNCREESDALGHQLLRHTQHGKKFNTQAGTIT